MQLQWTHNKRKKINQHSQPFLSFFSFFRNNWNVYKKKNEINSIKKFALIFADVYAALYTIFPVGNLGLHGFTWTKNGLRFFFLFGKIIMKKKNEKNKTKQNNSSAHVAWLIQWQFYVSSTFFCVKQCNLWNSVVFFSLSLFLRSLALLESFLQIFDVFQVGIYQEFR